MSRCPSVGAYHVIHVNVFLRDMQDFDAMNRAYAERTGDHRPARHAGLGRHVGRAAPERHRVAPSGGLTPFEIEEEERPALLEGAVGLVSTAPDFLRFCQMLLNKGELDGIRLLSARAVESMTANGLSDPVLRQRGGAMGWGLGNVDVVITPGPRGDLTAAGEYGWDGSAGTFFSIDPARQLVVMLFSQNVPASPDGLRQRFKAAVDQSIVQ